MEGMDKVARFLGSVSGIPLDPSILGDLKLGEGNIGAFDRKWSSPWTPFLNYKREDVISLSEVLDSEVLRKAPGVCYL